MITKNAVFMFGLAAFQGLLAWTTPNPTQMLVSSILAGMCFGAACVMAFVDIMLWRQRQ